MPVFSSKQVDKALSKKGFRLDNRHHKIYEYWHNGKLVSSTMASHNGQEIGDPLIAKMHKQLQISRHQFIDLIKCPLSEQDYIDILKEKGILN